MLEIQHLSSELVLDDINKGKFISQVLQEAKSNGEFAASFSKAPSFQTVKLQLF